jgi:CxxC-x17-CxxC domain-containing protein
MPRELQVRDDKVLSCKECGAEFVFTAGEQAFYASRDFQNEPKRCKGCRGARHATRPRRFHSEPNVETPITCSQCGKDSTVPFRPRKKMPLYCPACLQERRASCVA